MTISITIPGVTFSKFTSKVLMPFIDEAISFNLYGGSAAESIKNRAMGGAVQSAVLGTPTYSAGFANASNANGFDLGIMGDTPYTYVVCTQLISGNGAVIGRGPGNFVDMLTVGGGDLYHWPNGYQNAGVAGVDYTNFTMLGGQFDGSATARPGVFFHNGTAIVSVNTTVDTPKTVTATGNLRIGVGYGALVIKVAASAVYPRVMTPAELTQIHDYLKGLLSSRGVTLS